MFFLLPVLLGGLLGGAVGMVIGYLTRDIIDDAAMQVPNSFKYQIHKAKQRGAVHVGIFDENTHPLETITLEAEEIDSNLKYNKWYYLTN